MNEYLIDPLFHAQQNPSCPYKGTYPVYVCNYFSKIFGTSTPSTKKKVWPHLRVSATAVQQASLPKSWLDDCLSVHLLGMSSQMAT